MGSASSGWSESRARLLPLLGGFSLCTAGCHLCSARSVKQEGTRMIVGWSPWQQLMSLHQEMAGPPA